PEFGIEARECVAGSVIDKVGGRIVGGGLPDAAAADAPSIVLVLPALRAGLAWSRDRERAPSQLATVDVPGADPAAGTELAARALALEDQLLAALGLDGEWRSREGLRLRRRGPRCRVGRGSSVDLPDNLARILVERDHAHVVGSDEDLVAVEGKPAVGT